MVTGFEKLTQELNEFEISLIPEVVDILLKATSKDKAISNKMICGIINQKEGRKKLNEIRLRRIIHHIRFKGKVNRLCSNSNGYYIGNKTECCDYIQSLQERINAIYEIRKALSSQILAENQTSLNI